ncbi:MAG: SRPBCC family protein [Actinomycetota bacterium]|nr:SRPBCC family protein [Actinomycetota bacterium]
MPVYSRTITVNTDIESAFNFTADFRNLDKWNEGDEAELITKEPLREGSVFKVKTHFNNREMVLDYEIIEWGAPLRASLRTETNNFEIVDTIFLSANAKGTELTYSIDIKYKGIFIIIGLFFGPMFKKLMDTNIKNLEEVLKPL